MDLRSTNGYVKMDGSPFKSEIAVEIMNGKFAKENGSVITVVPTFMEEGVGQNSMVENANGENGSVITAVPTFMEEGVGQNNMDEQANGENGSVITVVPSIMEEGVGQNNMDLVRGTEKANGENGSLISPVEEEVDENNVDVENDKQEIGGEISQNGYDEADGPVENLAPIVAQKKEKVIDRMGLIAPNGEQIRRESVPKLYTKPKGRTDTFDAGLDNESHEEQRVVTKVAVEKRKNATLKINGNVNFCEIETVTYNRKHAYNDKQEQKTEEHRKVHKQHYVREITDQVKGDILLKPLDELIEVNGHKLKNESQKFVLEKFRETKLNKKDNELDLEIKVQRWVKDPIKSTDEDPIWIKVLEIEIILVLGPEEEERSLDRNRISRAKRRFLRAVNRKRRHKPVLPLSVRYKDEKIKQEQTLPEGNIHVDTVSPPFQARIEIRANQQYLHCGIDGILESTVIRGHNDDCFKIEPFHGMDRGPKPVTLYVFCCRISNEKNNNKWFLRYSRDYECVCDLDKDDPITDDGIDNRCFIKREIGSKTLLQSAIDRDRFVHFDQNSGKFTMKEIDSEELRKLTDPTVLPHFSGCWFDLQVWGKQEEHKQSSMFSFLSCGLLRSRTSHSQHRPHDFRSPRDFRYT